MSYTERVAHPSDRVFLLAVVVATKFGVLFSGEGAYHDHPELVVNSGASWVRLNLSLNANDQDYTPFLAAGLNVVLTINNRDPSNADTTYGTLQQWTRGGFPYKSRSAYEQRVSETLAPALPYLARGRQVLVQCENEVGDVAVNANGIYWRGTTDQYMAQLSGMAEAVRALSPSLRVVISSFTSDGLDAVLNPADPRYTYSTTRFSRMLTEGVYDFADLHFYGCASTIGAKAQWVTTRLPSGRGWISTENGGPDYTCSTTPLQYSQNPSAFEQSEAAQVPLRLKACSDNGGAVCLWFSLLDLKGESEQYAHLGLLDQSSSPPREKPAYAAYQTFIQSQAVTMKRRAVKH